jgi:hypothetical protein
MEVSRRMTWFEKEIRYKSVSGCGKRSMHSLAADQEI